MYMTEKQLDKKCLWDGKTMINPRSNQSYCNKECRENHKQSLKKRNNTPEIKTHKCTQCDDEFQTDKPEKEFCSSKCQQAWNNYWKSKGPSMAKAMLNWRVGRAKGGMTKVCQVFSAARNTHTERKKQKKASKE
jgi:hypothetical protein